MNNNIYSMAEKIFQTFKNGQDSVIVEFNEMDSGLRIVNQKEQGKQQSMIPNLYTDIANSYKYEAVNTIVRQLHKVIDYWNEHNLDGGEQQFIDAHEETDNEYFNRLGI